jgi:hypothetical protein
VQQQLRMGVAEGFGVELLLFVKSERMPPQHRENERCDDAHDRAANIDFLEIPLFNAGADHVADHRKTAMDDFVQIKIRELRKITCLGNDELGYRADW